LLLNNNSLYNVEQRELQPGPVMILSIKALIKNTNIEGSLSTFVDVCKTDMP